MVKNDRRKRVLIIVGLDIVYNKLTIIHIFDIFTGIKYGILLSLHN